MRIISGNFKGKKLVLPKNKITRPLKDLTKESIFNILHHSKKIKIDLNKSSILDLFSGVGSFGLECISRGAKKVVFCENYPDSIEILKRNIANLGCIKKSEVITENIFKIKKIEKIYNKKFDLIFCDPPYKEKKLNYLLNEIINLKILKSAGIIIIHRHKKEKEEFNKNFNILDKRNYGVSKIIFGN